MLTAFNTGDKFTEQFSLDYCIERYEHKTAESALKSKKIKLRELSNCYSKELIIAWIQAWLINLSSYMNFGITPQQAKTTAIFILEECYMMNMAELTLLFKCMKKGKYGIFYGKFNGQTILNACIEYRKERGKILSELTSEEQKEI